ncbi:MAG: radical SAM protein [Desulfitobacterium sp.]
MIIEIDNRTINQIKNPEFSQYAQIYARVYDHFIDQIKQTGLDLDENLTEETHRKLEHLREKQAKFRNSDKSIVNHWISSACEICQKGMGTVTFYISLRCHRNCYFCFNPNQEDYEHYTQHKRNVVEELSQLLKQGQKFSHIALTGGEPLLHKQEMLDFFRTVQEKTPKTHTRLYTSGDFLDQEILQNLKEAGLKEIRFSIKMEDPEPFKKEVYDRIALSKEFIPAVMVEMPVLPGSLKEMKDVLLELERIGIAGINLLELCFPFHNAEDFRKRGFKIKNPPFKVLYDYWYAGGLPISRSELECLELMEFALEQQLSIGVHYCSLENKQTGQIYQQNYGQKVSPFMLFSPRDYFFKSAKVFGEDIEKVLKVFKKKKVTDYQINQDYNFLEFHISQIKHLKDLDLEVGISSNVMEHREDGNYMRELKIDLVYPKYFDIRIDI